MSIPFQYSATRDIRLNQRISHDELGPSVGTLMGIADGMSVLISAFLATLIWSATAEAEQTFWTLWDASLHTVLVAAVMAPFMLREPAFRTLIRRQHAPALIRCFVIRFLLLGAVATGIGMLSGAPLSLPPVPLAIFIACTFALMSLARVLLARHLRQDEGQGTLIERIAIVGAGPTTERLITQLEHSRNTHVQIVGVFDDRGSRFKELAHQPSGTLADLIEMGKTCSMDWVLIVLPTSAELRLQAFVHRLKSLAVPIGLCPYDLGLATGFDPHGLVDDNTASFGIAPLAENGRTWIQNDLDRVLPRWIFTALGLASPLVSFTIARPSRQTLSSTQPKSSRLDFAIDDHDLEGFTQVAANFGQDRFGYIVTPNADHLIRWHKDLSFRALYLNAAYVLLDSRFISRLCKLTTKQVLPVCTGSDLTERLFTQVINPDDPLVLIGCGDDQADALRKRFGLNNLAHYNPPMGFIRDPEAVEAGLRFVEAHSPFRFCLLAIGAPQQEIFANHLKQRGCAQGLALCIGASINFLTGEEQRAPLWMQNSGLEWLFRLTQAPTRMAERYLIRGPQLFGLLKRTNFRLRSPAEAVLPVDSLVTSTITMTARPPVMLS